MANNRESVVPVHIEEEMRNSYLDYSMSVIISRALPDVRDGLKPVHRRVLTAMNDLNLTRPRPFRKSARDRFGLVSIRLTARIKKPGVQKPHWMAPFSTIAR